MCKSGMMSFAPRRGRTVHTHACMQLHTHITYSLDSEQYGTYIYMKSNTTIDIARNTPTLKNTNQLGTNTETYYVISSKINPQQAIQTNMPLFVFFKDCL